MRVQARLDNWAGFVPWIQTGSLPSSSKTAFIITEDGFLETNERVGKESEQVRLVTESRTIPAAAFNPT